MLDETQGIASVGGWEFIVHTNTLYWTRQSYDLHEVTPVEYKPTVETYLKFYAPECLEEIDSYFRNAIKNGVGFEAELEIITSKKNRRSVHVSCKVISRYARVDSLLGIVQDITVRKQIEKLVDSQKVALIASAKMSSLGEMAAGVAHEINNPLTIIVGKAEQLQSLQKNGNLEPEKLYEGLQKIQKTAHRISKIIRGLKTFSRDSKNDPMETILLSRVIEDSLELCRERIIGGGIDLRLDVAVAATVSVRGRSAQLEQTLINLIGNAFDAVASYDEKWVKIAVTTRDNERIQILVIDSGKGIATEVLEKLMQPFFTTKAVGKGTGLGLSISKGIIEEHSGRLYYDHSSTNTCFVIELPVYDSSRLSKAS